MNYRVYYNLGYVVLARDGEPIQAFKLWQECVDWITDNLPGTKIDWSTART